ncbi:MAG: mitofilin family membrane protein [Sneathiellaceae bacterium]
MSDGKQSKPEDAKPGKIIDAEVEPVSPEDAAKPGAPDDPPRVDLRGAAAQGTAGQGAAGQGAAAQGAARPAAADPAAARPAAGATGRPATGPGAAAKPGGGPAASGGKPATGAAGGEAARPQASRAAAARPQGAGAGTPPGGGGSAGGGAGGTPWSGGAGGGGGKPAGRSRGLIGALLAAVIVLAVLVVGLVASPLVAPWLPQALGVAGSGGAADPAELDRLQARLADLEGQMATAGKASQAVQGQAGDLADLRRTIDDLQKRVQTMGGLAGQMDQLQKQVAGLPRPDTAAIDDGMTKLQTQLQSMQQKLDSTAGPDPATQQRLKQVDDDLTSVTRLADSIQRRMSGMDNRLNDLRSRDDTIERRLTGLDDRIAAAAQPAPQVSTALAELRSQGAAQQGRLDSLESALEAERKARLAAEDQSSGRNQRVALVLTLGQIEDRLETGTAFGGEAATLPDLMTGSLARDPLAREAAMTLRRQGQVPVASFDQLRDGFSTAAAQALRQRPADAPAPGWWDQVVDGARGLVTIRPVGDVAGDSPGALLARAEQALAMRDLPRAVAEVGQLTGGPAEAMAGWLEQARARLAMTAALAQLNDAVTSSLTPGMPEAAPRAAAPPAEPPEAEPPKAEPPEAGPAKAEAAGAGAAAAKPAAPAAPAPAAAAPADTPPAAGSTGKDGQAQ